MLTVRDAAKWLQVSCATVYKLCASGALPSYRVANSIRILPEDLNAYLERQDRPQDGR